jgi:small conductance mechanosensitive channel
MSQPRLAIIPSVPDPAVWAVVGVLVFLVFVAGSRLASRAALKALRRNQIRHEYAVLAGRALTFALIGLGAVIAIAVGVESQNVAIAGIVLATIVASFGVQDVLKDYVSGYYVLLERHITAGDRISSGSWSGEVLEIKLRVTLLRNPDGDQVVVPNSVLFHEPVIVHARPVPEASRPAHPE